ncbi:DUF4382 domain-containing protein [Proteobacteria bacterium 005FR1]|nr:DUF4382 domain-containing protein [Proteobacteria bacterium 005FR1]
MKFLRFTPLALCATGLVALTGCGGGSSSSDGASTGTLGVSVTDAPVDSASRVMVQFDGIEIQPAAGERITFTFDSPRQIDLLSLQGNNSEPLLDGEQVPAGEYEWMRVMVTGNRTSLESFIELETDGTQHPLWVPSGAQTGLKLVQGFTVPVGGSADFTIDFDLRKSITKPGQSGDAYILKPALRLVNNVEVGTLTGTVPTEAANAEACSPSAYVYAGLDVTADDEGSATSPLTSALISMDEATGNYTFTVGFLSAGDYTVTWTCQADLDDPATDDDILFEASQNVTIVVDQTAEVIFD